MPGSFCFRAFAASLIHTCIFVLAPVILWRVLYGTGFSIGKETTKNLDPLATDIELLRQIRQLLTGNQQTVAVAESVTAGHLQVMLSLAEKAMDFFQGGITTYNIGQKTKHLNIDPIHAQTCDCVSEKVALEMSIAVGPLFSADWGIAITGYASPVPELGITELFAYYAFSFKGQPVGQGILRADNNGDPVAVRLYYTHELLLLFKEALHLPYSPAKK
ncbi:UNVERIFIED_ORG: PncC family amidohydrolase [Chitinophaga ginsengisegetis]